jgi:hypothetical protein
VWGESGESVSLVSRTPKACAIREFVECESASCRFSGNGDNLPQRELFALKQQTICFSAPFLDELRWRNARHDALALKRITFYKDRQRFDEAQQE